MDLNYLYHRQQIERWRADSAGCPASRQAHTDMADAYGAEIELGRALRTAAITNAGDR